MGEARKGALRVGFDSQIKLEFHGASVTADAGLVAHRELDEALGLTALADELFRDRCEGGASLEIRVLPDGRGGGPAQTLRRHPGSHPAPACRARHGACMMFPPARQNGSRCNGRRGCPAPTTRNEVEKPPWHALEVPFQPGRPEKTRKWGSRNGGALLQYRIRLGGVAGQGQMRNVGSVILGA